MGDIAELLLDVTDDLSLGGGGEGVASLGEDLHQVVGEFTASQVKTEDGVGESITFIDGDRESTAWIATYMAGMLKVSNMIWVIFSRLALGLRGASVRRTGCSSGATRSSL